MLPPADSPRTPALEPASTVGHLHHGGVLPTARDGVERFAAFGLAALAGALLLGWLPHYLTWPWWPDQDTNAQMAHAWNQGIRPYRDISAFTFPGQIYIFSLLDKLGARGQTWPFLAVDAGLILAVCLGFLAWSVRLAGRWLPGWFAVLALLHYLLGLNFSLVAQRDSQAVALVLLALISTAIWPRAIGRLLSAVFLGLAMAFRPHVILFIPAILLATGRRPDRGPGPFETQSIGRGFFLWMATFSASILLVFAPLLWQGLLPDFIRGIRLAAYGGPYSRASLPGVILSVLRQTLDLRFLAVPVALGLFWKYVDPPHWLKREMAIWLLAGVAVAFYLPVHPVRHDYLAHAAWMIWAGQIGTLALSIQVAPNMNRVSRWGLYLLLAGLAFPGKPTFVNIRSSLHVTASVLRGRGFPEAAEPPGYRHHMDRYQVFLPPWHDYQAAMTYLRDEILPGVEVANLMKYQLSFNGSIGRLSPFRNESGILWITQVGWSESRFVKQLDASPDAVVVWSPSAEGPDTGFKFPELESYVRTHYEPAARFGQIEIWKRPDR